MATISNIKQRDIASMFTENEQKAIYNEAVERYEKEQKESQNKGGFFGGIGYVFEKIGLGFLSSVEGIWDYTAGGLAKLFGADDWAEQQFANDWVNYSHADEWYNPSKGWQVVGDVAGGIGTSLPAIAAVAAAGAIAVASGGTLTPVSSALISATVAGLGAAGNATKEAYRETGELGGKEFGYGALVGVTEGAVEGISAGIGAGTGQVVKGISKQFGKEIAESATRETLGKAVVKGFIGEAFEEGLSEILDPVWARLTYDPNAENATLQEVGYAALIGGLSGAIMGGVDVSVRNISSTVRGNTIVSEGKANNVMQMSEQLNSYENTNQTGLESFELVQNVYKELQDSMQKTNGQIKTMKQKMLLGVLEKANTTAVFSPIVARSAENIVNNADIIAQRLNSYGYTDTKGNPITFTAEQIREGVDLKDSKSFSKALKKNDVLRSLAVADATGQITMDTAKFKESTLMGERLSSQVDLNRFIETATDSELQAVGEKLGIDNWQGLTSAEFQEKITDFARNGGIEAYKNERLIVKDADSISADTAQKLPSKIDMQENGIKRYYLGDSQVAIIKDGDNYRIYDYSSKRLSKVLTESELNKVLKQLNTQEKSVADSVKQQLETESELKRQAAEIDEYARENISEYKTLNAPSQSMIRQIIRNGRAAGVSEDFVLTTARVSARSGLNIVFSKEASFVTANGTYADGAIDLKNNQIIINPDAKNRTGEMILIHELTHAIYNLDGGVLQVAEGLETMTDTEKKSITDRYTKIGKGSAVEVSDEINAHFAEQTLSNKNILERLVAKKPTVKEKILKFFKKSSVDYSEDAKLTGAAKKLFKQYQKLFNDFSARNQGNNATEINANKGLDSYALAKDEKNGYNNQKGVENGKENSKQETREECLREEGYTQERVLNKIYKEFGFDGIIAKHNRDAVVAFFPNQIKEITNKTPTKDTDIRFALTENEDNRRVGGLTKAQRAKFVANNTKLKVYSRTDAEVIINDILANRLNLDERYVANLSGKSKNEIIDYLFKQLNGANEGYRGTVALKIADYIIENATMEDMYASMYDLAEDTDIELVAYMNKYRHSFDLSGIQGEINYKFDRKNTIALQWGTKKGGMGADQIAQEIEGMGLHTFTAINEADQFFEMLEAYDAANKRLNTKVDKKKLSDYGDQAQIDSLRQEIAKDILKSYDSKGTKSKYGKLVEKYTEKIADLRQQVKDVQERNNVLNSLLDRAQKMKDLKLGTFLNATDFKSETFKKSIESLASIKYRGNFNNAGTHRVLSELRQWYSRENPLLENIYNEDVEFMLDILSRADKNYSTKELKMLRDTMSYFINLVENYNRVYKQGKWIEAIPEAQRYIDVIHSNEQLKVGIFSKLAGSGYMQTFGDPLTVARRMDRYDSSGFYTEMMTELRNATVDSEIAEMEIKSGYNEFLSTNKKYLAEIKKNKVKFNGVEIPKTHLLSLYMTMKRSHSHAGLVLNGFSFVDTDGKKVRVNGFAPSVTTDAEILTAIADAKIEIENLLSDTDMQFVAILEKCYNVDAKKLKADRDIQRLGFTNATEDYYYPIRRGNIAKNIDTSDIASELDRVSNSSFNKDTVKGAKQELFIESAATVFNRHIKAVTKYAYLSPAIETFNRLYSLDISGNKNKPVSVSTESANTWSKANKYFSKLISDIQGIPSSSSEGMKVLSFIRSSYAKFQLGANPKVWVTQLSSLFASSSMLDTDCIIRGMTVSAKDVDTYCSLAKLRNSDNTVAMAQGLLEKVDKFSNALMTPIGKMDRFVVKRLFGACQVQVEKNGGAKVGTTANKVEAGKLLRNVILETQQNSMATERSAAMRSGNEIMRTITMFSADSMKVAGRVIDSIGELSTLKAKLKNTTDSAARSKILSQIKTAKTKVRKSVTALITSAAFMVSVAKLFRWLYKKDEDENTAEVMTVDFIGNLFGGLPVIKEIYGRFAEGYDVDNYAYSAVNDLLDSVQDIYDIIESLSSGNATEQDINKAIKKLSFSAGQILGIPTRNMYNILLGLTKRISPTTAYQFESKIYKKNFVSDLNEAIENDDTAMVNLIMSMILDERVGDDYSEVLTSAMKKLYTSGYSVLPKSIGSSITYNGETITLTNAQQKKIKSVYGKTNAYAEKMVLGNTYKGLTEEQQAKALKQLYDAYYSKALQETLGIESDNKLLKMSKYIPIDRIAAINAGISDITSDKTSTGKVVTGSKRSKVIKYLLKQNLTDEQRLLILAFQGYTVNNLEYKGWTTEKVKNRLLRYILSIKTATQAEKIELCEMCGFEVKNGVVVKQSLYSKK